MVKCHLYHRKGKEKERKSIALFDQCGILKAERLESTSVSVRRMDCVATQASVMKTILLRRTVYRHNCIK